MRIPLNELIITFSRSQGPGGQNVNKTSSKAQLRWDILSSKTLSSDEKALLIKKLTPYLTWRNEVIISSEQTRSQLQNKQLVIKRLNSLVEKALLPSKNRIPTKPTTGSKNRRLAHKKQHGQKKKIRRLIDFSSFNQSLITDQFFSDISFLTQAIFSHH